MARIIFKKVFLFSLFLSTGFSSFCQDFKMQERVLLDHYLRLLHAPAQQRVDSLGPLFKKKLLEMLQIPGSFNYPFDSLKLYVTVASSPDKRVRTFSWDEHTGRSNHTMAAIIQISGRNNSAETKLMPGNDVMYYEWHQVNINNEWHYLSFGYGSYGSSNHFKRVDAFRIREQGLQPVTGLFNWSADFGNSIFIIAPKKKKIFLQFDAAKNELSFRQFIQKDFENVKFKKGKIITLTLRDGYFQLPQK